MSAFVICCSCPRLGFLVPAKFSRVGDAGRHSPCWYHINLCMVLTARLKIDCIGALSSRVSVVMWKTCSLIYSPCSIFSWWMHIKCISCKFTSALDLLLVFSHAKRSFFSFSIWRWCISYEGHLCFTLVLWLLEFLSSLPCSDHVSVSFRKEFDAGSSSVFPSARPLKLLSLWGSMLPDIVHASCSNQPIHLFPIPDTKIH